MFFIIDNLRNRANPWLRWLIILGVLALSAISYSLAQRIPWMYLVGAIGTFFFAWLALQNMPLALTLVLLTSATTGITIGTGSATPLPIGLLLVVGLAAVWLVRMALVDRRIYLKPSPLNLPLLVFLAAALVSWAYGFVLWDWKLPIPKGNLVLVQVGQYAIFALSFTTTFLVAHQALGRKDLQRWVLIICFIGVGGMLFELVTGSGLLRERGVTGAVLTWAVVLIGGQLLFNPELKTGWRLAAGLALLVFAVWAVRNLDWKSGWVPALMGLALLFLLRVRKWGLPLLIGGVLIALTQGNFLYQKLVLPEWSLITGVRPLFWLDVIRLTSRSPILGLGLVNYKFFWADPTFMPLSRIAAGWATWNAWGYAPPSHNMFVDVYAQTGLLGLGLFVWGMGAAVWMLFKVSRRFVPGFMKAFTTAVLCGFIAMLVGSFVFAEWLLPYVYNLTITGFSHSVYSWILLGTVLGIYYQQEEKPGGTSP